MTEIQPKKNVPLDIAAISDLADRAGSEIATLKLSSPIVGVPTEIPVYLNRKDSRLENVSELFEPTVSIPAGSPASPMCRRWKV